MIEERKSQPMLVLSSPAHIEHLLMEATVAHFDELCRAAGLDAERARLTEEQLEREMEQIRREAQQE